MTEEEFAAWIERTASGLSDDAGRLYLRLCDEMIEVDDVLNPEEEELIMAGLVSHVRAAGRREYHLEPESMSKWSLGVQRALEARFPTPPDGKE